MLSNAQNLLYFINDGENIQPVAIIEPRLILPRRGVANRLWRPSLFLDDDALLKPGSWINDPWWHKYPELRPLDLATAPWNRPHSSLRTSYLSPIKRTYVWGYRHPLRPFGINISSYHNIFLSAVFKQVDWHIFSKMQVTIHGNPVTSRPPWLNEDRRRFRIRNTA